MKWVSRPPPNAIADALAMSSFAVLTRPVFVFPRLPIGVEAWELRRAHFFAVSQATVRDAPAHHVAPETSLRRFRGRTVRPHATRPGKLPHPFVLLLGQGEGS